MKISNTQIVVHRTRWNATGPSPRLPPQVCSHDSSSKISFRQTLNRCCWQPKLRRYWKRDNMPSIVHCHSCYASNYPHDLNVEFLACSWKFLPSATVPLIGLEIVFVRISIVAITAKNIISGFRWAHCFQAEIIISLCWLRLWLTGGLSDHWSDIANI